MKEIPCQVEEEDLFTIDDGEVRDFNGHEDNSDRSQNDKDALVVTEAVDPVDEAWKDADFLRFSDVDEQREMEKPKNELKEGEKKVTSAQLADTSEEVKHEVTQEDQNSVPELSNPLPPWMTLNCLPRHHNNKSRSREHHRTGPSHRVPPLLALHNEIVGFSKLVSPQDFEIQMRDDLVSNLRQLAHDIFGGPDKCELIVFGSLATKLFLPSSDIDVVIYLPKKSDEINYQNSQDQQSTSQSAESTKEKEKREMKEWEDGADNRSPLIRLAHGLRSFYKEHLIYLEVVEQTRIPIVKFTHGPTNISVDVCFDQEGGPEAAQIMTRFLDDMPPLRPLVFVLKHFMKIRGINEPYLGGMGSFMLQMMIVSFLQHRAREEYNKYSRSIVMNLGSLLLDFFEFYSLDFNYITTAISVRNDGSYFPKGAKSKRDHFYQPLRPNSLAIENPLDLTSDVGKSTFRVNQIQRSFDVAFRLLLAHVSMPFVHTDSILASILPPTQVLRKRADMLNALTHSDPNYSSHGDNFNSAKSRKKHHTSQKKTSEQIKQNKKRQRNRKNIQYYDICSSDDDDFLPLKKQSGYTRTSYKPRTRGYKR